MPRDYTEVEARIRALCAGDTDEIAPMATLSCELFQALDGFDWVGFYRVVAPDLLKIGPCQGGHGRLAIPFVCGDAARERRMRIMPDVEAFPGQIACAASIRFEIVLPVRDPAGRLIAAPDVESDAPAAFDAADAAALRRSLDAIFAAPAPSRLTAAADAGH